MTFLQRLLRRTPPPVPMTVKQDEPYALYLGGDGRMQAIKSTGFVPSGYGGRVGLGYVAANAEQYARAAIASVWAANCINLRADTMARFDWFVQNKRTKKKIDNHPFTLALECSKQNVMRLMEKRLLTFGEFFLKPLLNDGGYPAAFQILNNLDVDVDTSQVPFLQFRYTPEGARFSDTYFMRGVNAPPRKQIVYIYTDNDFDDYRGLSKFESVMLEIGIDRDISRTTASFYKNDARPGLLLLPEHDFTSKEQLQEFVDSWNMQFQGPGKAGKAGVAPRALRDVREFQRPPTIDDVELRESTRREICAAFKVPLSMAGAWDDATYQSLPEQRKFFYEETMIPSAEANAEDLTKHALPFFDESGENEVAFDATSILALVENAVEKVDINTKKLQAGGMTINEYRKANGDDPVEGGNIFIMQSGWIPVRKEDLATYDAPNTAPVAEPPALPEPQAQPVVTPDTEAQPIQAQLIPTRHDHTHDHSPVLYVPDETIAVKTIHDEALHELRAWQKFHANGTAAKRDFTVYMITDDIADTLKAELLLAGEDRNAIKAAFKQAESQIAIKQADVVRNNFETELKTLIDIGTRRDIARLEFTNRLKRMIYHYGGNAMRAGLTDGGVITAPDEPLETEDAAVFEGMYTEQAQYATGLSAQVYEDTLTPAQALLKPRQWWGKTMQPFYDAGLLSAARNQMVEVVGTVDDNSCATCKALAGQRHRRRTLHAAGLMPPYGSGIICSDGGLCKHRVIAVNSRSRGNLSRVPRHA